LDKTAEEETKMNESSLRVVHVHIHSTGTLFASFAPRLRYGLTLWAFARSSLRS
jgi:hypothetical protein